MSPQLPQAPARSVPFSPPNITEAEIAEVVDTLRSDWITTGPKTRKFEEEFAAYVQAPGALALNSCTAGLHIALLTLGVRPGDRVATTPMTFAASVNVIEHVGAVPVLCDVEPDTLNLSPAALERGLEGARAIVAVHYAGHPVDMGAITALARGRGIPIVEDAAHALPARHGGRMIGGHGNLTAFSFYATKNLTTAEGGMLTGDPGLLERARVLHLHGMSKDAARRYEKGGSWRYDILAPGFKYNMTDVQAAIGRVQLTRMAEMHARRLQLVARYDRAFADLPELETLPVRPDVESAHHLYVLRLDTARLSIDRDEFVRRLADLGVTASVHFIPIHVHPYYRDKYGWAPTDFPVAWDAFQRMLSLPLYSRMSDEDADYVVDCVRRLVETSRR
ncbi:MAG: DegT/DnrJ/EryC1/StrS family aminotransferase [Planctomycetota bacterium]